MLKNGLAEMPIIVYHVCSSPISIKLLLLELKQRFEGYFLIGF